MSQECKQTHHGWWRLRARARAEHSVCVWNTSHWSHWLRPSAQRCQRGSALLCSPAGPPPALLQTCRVKIKASHIYNKRNLQFRTCGSNCSATCYLDIDNYKSVNDYQCLVEVIFAPLVSEEYLSQDSILTPLSNRKALRYRYTCRYHRLFRLCSSDKYKNVWSLSMNLIQILKEGDFQAQMS